MWEQRAMNSQLIRQGQVAALEAQEDIVLPTDAS